MMLTLIRWTKPLFLAMGLALLSALLLAGLTPLGVQAAPPAPGSLDTTFDTDGVVTTPIGSGYDIGRAVVIQSDGKIVVAGYSYNGSYNDFALARYTITGSLDSDFGSSGVVTTNNGSGNAVAVQGDGKIVVAGSSDGGFGLARYTITGSLDSDFGNGGFVTTTIIDYNAEGNAVAVQSDGKIVVAGFSQNTSSYRDFALARYTITGSLDSDFGSGGFVTTDFGGWPDNTGRAVVVQSDGKIVVAGSREAGCLELARYNTDGSLDITFDTDGMVTTCDSIDSGRAVAVQSDGKIVVTGYSGSGEFVLIRYNTDGSLDSGFGAGGIVTISFDYGAYSYAMALHSNGKIVVAGNTWSPNGRDFALAFSNSNGSLDTAFGSGGKVTTSFGSGDDYGQAVTVQSDGKIVVAGYSSDGSSNVFALARYIGLYKVYLPLVVRPLDTTR